MATSSSKKRNIRVVVRPWTPRRVPYTISVDALEQVLIVAYPKLKEVLYVGWTKRRVAGKLTLMYIAATGDTTQEARQAFKKSEDYNESVWKFTDAGL
jgi:hypothetical protein